MTGRRTAARHPRIADLLGQLHRAFDRRSWHGPNLTGSIRGLNPGAAACRPGPGRHNAWEVVVHAAYWKYRLCRLLAADPPESFSFPGSDWWERPVEATGAAWKADVRLLRDWHARLVEAVEARRADPSAPAHAHRGRRPIPALTLSYRSMTPHATFVPPPPEGWLR